MKYIIYCLRYKNTGKIFYVGSTSVSIESRLSRHIAEKNLDKNNIVAETLEAVYSKEIAKKRENHYIVKYNTVEDGLNVTYGYGRRGLGPNDTSFKEGNELGKLGIKSVMCIETGKTFESITQCAKEMNLSISKISAVCRGKRKTHGGYTFTFL